MKITGCLMGIGLLLLSAARDTSSYTTCPIPADVPLNGACTTKCSSNTDCAEVGSLCCPSATCEQQCAHSITIPHPRPILGCPIPDPDMAGTCQEDCSNCTDEQRCCSNGCGHVCTTLVEVTPICQAIRDAHNRTLMPGEYLPRCDENGDFTMMQCHSSTGYCWCVEPESGKPLGGVVRHEQPQCSCVHNGSYYHIGEHFPVECNTCICEEGGRYSCTEMGCNIPSDSLLSYSSCPETGGLAGICSEECSNDTDCIAQQKCCSNGCGHTCIKPVSIPYIALPLECPDFSNKPIICDVRECNDSSDCADNKFCCQNPCGSVVCTPPSPPPFPCTAAVNSLNGALLGGFVPKCDSEDGSFRPLQCFSYYCWCVATDTGVPVTGFVLSTNIGYLECSNPDTCLHNGKLYQHQQHLDDDCGCLCYHGSIICAQSRGGDPCNNRAELLDNPFSSGADPVWWHYIIIGCGVLIAVLAVVAVGLLIIMVLLMRYNRFRHKRLRESPSDTFEPEPAVVFKTGPLEAESVELKVPLEDPEPVDT